MSAILKMQAITLKTHELIGATNNFQNNKRLKDKDSYIQSQETIYKSMQYWQNFVGIASGFVEMKFSGASTIGSQFSTIVSTHYQANQALGNRDSTISQKSIDEDTRILDNLNQLARKTGDISQSLIESYARTFSNSLSSRY